MPPLTTQAWNATKAMGRVSVAVVESKPVYVSDEVSSHRLSACLQCESCVAVPSKKTQGKTYHRCRECGCWLDGRFQHKARLATESCPQKKWEVVRD